MIDEFHYCCRHCYATNCQVTECHIDYEEVPGGASLGIANHNPTNAQIGQNPNYHQCPEKIMKKISEKWSGRY